MVVAGPSMQLLGSTWARAFASKGETGPDLHHGKSELRAKQQGGEGGGRGNRDGEYMYIHG